jgi:signal transduction histidine kinase
MSSRIPISAERSLWGVVLAMVTAPFLVLVLHALLHRSSTDLLALDGTLLSPALLVSAALAYVAWRVAPSLVSPWLVACLVLVALHQLGLVASRLSYEGARDGAAVWLLGGGIVFLALLAVGTTLAGRSHLRVDPALAALAAGGAVLAPQALAVTLLPPLAPGPLLDGLLIAVLVLLGLLVLLRLPRTDVAPALRHRVAAVVVLVVGLHLTHHLGGFGPTATLTVVVLDLLVALLLASCGLRLVLMALRHDQLRVEHLRQRVGRLEAGVRDRRAIVHEINATLAGISSATQLIRDPSGISQHRRRLLLDMVDVELARLSRLASPPQVVIPRQRSVSLDDTISILALAQEARGNRVHWRTSGICLAAEPDAVASLLNILLDNATQHADAEITVSVRQREDTAEIIVSDNGPGIPPEVKRDLFAWGARGPQSAGQGIGLSMARDLAVQQGGYLRLLDTPSAGATFIVGLPALATSVIQESHERTADLA